MSRQHLGDRSRLSAALTVVALAASVVTMVTAVPGAPGADAAERTVGRVAGDTRLETAVRISQRAFPSRAEVAYLARSDVFADALAAGTLVDGPVLLVPSCGPLPEVVSAELARLAPDTVLALGGPSAVCDDVLAAAGAGRPTGRVAGANRYLTAIRIAQRGFRDGAEEVYLASAADSPDAVAGGSLTRGPILLVPREGDLPQEVRDEIERLSPTRVVALGGAAAITDDTVLAAAGGRPILRLAGADRYETAARIAEYQFGAASSGGGVATVAYLARGDVVADAVAAGSLTDGPVLLVPSCDGLPDGPARQVQRLAPASVLALGGPGAVCDQTLVAAGDLPGVDVVIPETTVVLDGAARDALRSDEGGVLLFDGPGAPAVEPGDVIVSHEVPGVARQGLLRRVTGVRTGDDGLVVETEPASLTDAVHEGELTVDVPLTRADLLDASGPAARQQARSTTNLVELDRVATAELAPGVTLSGSLRYDASLQVDVDVDLFPTPHVEEFTAALATEQASSLTLTATGAANWTPAPVTLWEGEFRCFWTAIGPVPVSLCPRLTIQLTASGAVEGRISMGASQSMSSRFGASYRDGTWSPIREREENHSFTSPSLEVDATAAAGLRGELGLEVYDLAGPYVWGSVYVRGRGQVLDDMVCRGLYAGLAGGFGVAVDEDILGDLEIPELELIRVETALVEEPQPHDVCNGDDGRQGPSWYGTVHLTFDEVYHYPSETSTSGSNQAEAVVHLTGEVTSFDYQGVTYESIRGVALSGSQIYDSRYDYLSGNGDTCTQTDRTVSGALGPNADLAYAVRPSADAVAPTFGYVGVEWMARFTRRDSCDSSFNADYEELSGFGWNTDFDSPTVVDVPGGRRICDTIVQSRDTSSGSTVDRLRVTATFALASGTAEPDCP